MLLFCEPRFKYIDETDNGAKYVLVNEVENQAYLRKQIVTILSDLFPDKIGDVEAIGESFYGITVFDADDIDDELQKINDYNAEKHASEARYKGKTLQTTINLYTFMNRGQYPRDMTLTLEDIKEIDRHGVNLAGLDHLDNIFLTSADLSGTNFNGSGISNSIFNDTLLVASQFTDTTIKDTNFSGADIRYATFNVAMLKNVTFAGADLRYADFIGATLTNVDLSGADLRYANLSNVTLDGNCNLTGAKFVNLETIMNTLYAYPPNIFDGAMEVAQDGEYDDDEYDDDDGDAGELGFLTQQRGIFSSADVKPGEEHENNDDDDDDDYVNTKPPVCADVINGYDINIQAYLAKNDAHFTIQLPNSNNYECVNLNDVKKYHIKTDKAGTKYYNYVYACLGDTPYLSISEDKYTRTKAYIRMGSFNLIVEKPDWFPGAEFPIYRKFKLVKTGAKPAFVTETMIRHGEQGDDDYIQSEWHCNAGQMETYRLEPLMEGGRKKKKTLKKKTQKKKTQKKKKKTKTQKTQKTQKKTKTLKQKNTRPKRIKTKKNI